jgi:hypothetical protein
LGDRRPKKKIDQVSLPSFFRVLACNLEQERSETDKRKG